MKAVICTKYGSPEVLKLQQLEKPIPKDNEVLIKMHATNVTSGDVRIRAFKVPLSFWLPARLVLGMTKPKNQILGSIFAGEVVEVGKNVKKFQVGQRVFGSNSHQGGTYAEYISIFENGAISIIPKNLSYNEASAVLWGGETSLHFLKMAKIARDQRVMIIGASGSLGTSAVQLAKYYNANVTGVCSTGNVELVESLGANKIMDYTKEDVFSDKVKYDVIFDTVGKSDVSKAINSLAPEGTFIHAVATPATELRIKLALLGSKKKYIGGTLSPTATLTDEVAKLTENGVLIPVIDKIYTLGDIVEAHRYVDEGHKKGNVVVSIN